MAEHHLDDADGQLLLQQQVGGKAVTQGVHRDALVDQRSFRPLPCSTRSVMRLLSMSVTFRPMTSLARRPVP